MPIFNDTDVAALVLPANAVRYFDAAAEGAPNGVVGKAVVELDERAIAVRPIGTRVTICVGANNSGKSRFLRAIAVGGQGTVGIAGANRDVEFRAWRAKVDEFNAWTNTPRPPGALREELRKLVDLLDDAVFSGHSAHTWVPGLARPLPDGLGVESKLRTRLRKVPVGARETPQYQSADAAAPRLMGLIGEARSTLVRLAGTRHAMPKAVYVPPLRTLRKLGADLPTYNARAYAAVASADAAVFTGDAILDEVKKLILGGAAGRAKLLAFERFVSDTCFSGRTVGISPIQDPDKKIPEHIEIQVGDDPGRHIDELGDGVAQVFLLAFPVFFDPKRTFLLDEPETHLHPGFQRAILRLYAKHAQGPVFIATHSNHLIDMVEHAELGIGVLRFSKQGAAGVEGAKFEIDAVMPGDLATLADLGARLSSVARANAVIWVEGITDRILLSALIRHVGGEQNVLVEDLHFSFAAFGGAAVAHHNFSEEVARDMVNAMRVGGEPIVVVDTDDGNKATRNEMIKKALGDKSARFKLTPGREIENILPPAVLRAATAEVFKVDGGVLEKLIPDGDQDEYLRAPLGTWLQGRLQGEASLKLAEDSGTLCRKPSFALAAAAALARQPGVKLHGKVSAWVQEIIAELYTINELKRDV